MGGCIEGNPWEEIDLTNDKPFVLKCDKNQVIENNERWRTVNSKRRHKLRTELFPMPIIGNTDEAEIFLLQANPGVALAPLSNTSVSERYKGIEYFRRAVEQSLHQNFDTDYPFYFLDPELHRINGSFWWRTILSDLLEAVAIKKLEQEYDLEPSDNDSFFDVLNRDAVSEVLDESDDMYNVQTVKDEFSREIYETVSNNICAVELHGYRSLNYRTPDPMFTSSSHFQAKIVADALKDEKKHVVLMKANDDWKELIDDVGEGFENRDQVYTLSSNQNSKISRNNLEGDGAFDKIVRVF